MGRDFPTSVAMAYLTGIGIFGGLGAAAGLVLWGCGLPWHRVLTCGGVGALLGVLATALGLWMGGRG